MALPRATTDRGTEVRRRIGRNIRVLLTARGVEAQALARHCGWAPSAVTRRMSGETAVAAHELAEIAEFLDVEPGVFFLETEALIRSKWSQELQLVPPLPLPHQTVLPLDYEGAGLVPVRPLDTPEEPTGIVAAVG